jgi:hypothetical protein
MAAYTPVFRLFFESMFLSNYERLKPSEKKAIDKAVRFLALSPRHPSLSVHKARNVRAKYPVGGTDVFIGYASRSLRFTFEFGPEDGFIALRNCGHHDVCESKI